MDTKVATYQYGGHGLPATKGKVYSNKVCQFWLKGKCNRNPCRFLHRESPTSTRQFPAASSNVYRRTPEQSNHLVEEKSRKTSNYGPKHSLASRPDHAPKRPRNNISASISKCNGSEIEYTSMESLSYCTEMATVISPAIESSTKACQDWMSGHCVKGDGCQFLHSWSTGDSFSMLGQLKGHTKVICGVALPSGSDMLFSASNDGIVNGWFCHTGQLTRTINLGEEIGCLIGEGLWVFVGLQNSIKVWNFETKMEYTLAEQDGASGLVNTMVTSDDDMLFTGGQDGSILVWKASNDNLKPFKLASTLKGHTAAVTCLIFGNKRLYSGSIDGEIRCWDLDTFKCLHLLKEHTDAVTSVICWEACLLSSSLDKKIKVWAATEKGTLEVIYTHDLEHAPIALRGIDDEEENSILLCSCDDNCVRLLDLPSFKVRGEIDSRDEVRRIEPRPGGLFFTGDALGTLSVWKLAESSSGQKAAV